MNPLILYDLFPTPLPLLFGHEIEGDFFDFLFTNGHARSCISSIYIYR